MPRLRAAAATACFPMYTCYHAQLASKLVIRPFHMLRARTRVVLSPMEQTMQCELYFYAADKYISVVMH